MVREITITDENSIILDSFKVSDKDALRIAEDYATDWMDDEELLEYFKDGSL
jgi:hypothetical protein